MNGENPFGDDSILESTPRDRGMLESNEFKSSMNNSKDMIGTSDRNSRQLNIVAQGFDMAFFDSSMETEQRKSPTKCSLQ